MRLNFCWDKTNILKIETTNYSHIFFWVVVVVFVVVIVVVVVVERINYKSSTQILQSSSIILKSEISTLKLINCSNKKKIITTIWCNIPIKQWDLNIIFQKSWIASLVLSEIGIQGHFNTFAIKLAHIHYTGPFCALEYKASF